MRRIYSVNHRRKFKAKPITRVVFVLMILFTFFSFCESRIRLLPNTIIETSARTFAESRINKVIKENFADIKNSYNLHFDENNKLTLLDTDAVKISLLTAEMTSDLNSDLNGRQTAYIPIGNLLDSKLLNGYGLNIPVSLYFNGSAHVQINSEIVSAGVNQSNFRLTADIRADIYSNSVTSGGMVTVSGEYLLCEAVILGETPMFTWAN